MLNLKKNLLKVVSIAALSLAASSAFAAPGPFTVNPNSNGLTGGTLGTFTALSMAGSSSTQLTFAGTSGGSFNYTGVGFIDYSAFTPAVGQYSAAKTGLGSNYQLYATFTQTFSCSSFLGSGVTCGVTSIDLHLWANNSANEVSFNNATLSQAASVDTTGASPVELGNGNIGYGVAGLDALGGAFENINTNFALTAAGKNFFIAPNPFYTLTFNGFNNTSQGVETNGTVFAVNSESGTTDFNFVPEPTPLALLGIGLFAMGLYRRKTQA